MQVQWDSGPRWFLSVLALWGLVGSAGGEERLAIPGQAVASSVSKEAEAYGTEDPGYVNVHAYAFQPTYSTDLITEDGNGYRYFGAPPVSAWMAAPVQLPSGVVIERIGFSYCSQEDWDIEVTLFDNGVAGAGSGGGTPIASTHTVSGCNLSWSLAPAGGYLYARNLDHPLYLVIYWAGDFDGSTKFNDVIIAYRRAVSPAPVAASFTDVPTSHPFFQYIEALADSGITGGCNATPPLYCPGSPLTRGQMAVFLAKALGLHWPY
jgi:S-layer homology domain